MDSPLTSALAVLLDPSDAAVRAAALLARIPTPRRLAQLSAGELTATRLVSAREADRIAASFILASEAYRMPTHVALQRPELVARLFPELWCALHEELWAVPVDTRLRPTGRELIARGGPDRVVTSVADILRRVLVAGGAGFFLVHNHPSGDAAPSPLDRRFTREVERGARELGLALHDHLVVAGDRWESCLREACGVTLGDDVLAAGA